MVDDSKVSEAIAAVKSISALHGDTPLFDLYFPLPYRICSALLVGIWCWGLNVKILTAVHIDVGQLVKYSFSKGAASTKTPAAPRSRHHGIYQMATVLSLAVALSWIFFAMALSYQLTFDTFKITSTGIRGIDFLPWATLVLLIASFFLPGHQFHSAGRRRFRDICSRVVIGDLDFDCRFADILVADALTSYTRVLLDLVVACCMFLSGKSCVGKPDRSSCSGPATMLVVLSIPSLIRFRQCVIDFARTGSTLHLVNCMKYASAIPVVVFSALQKVYKDVDSKNGGGLSAAAIYHMWLLAALINSIYSFIWDVSQDWGLEMIGTSPLKFMHRGLRQVLALKPTSWYYFAIIIDLGLRMLWAHKLTTNWAGLGDYESGLFLIELLEIFRRGMWICFRVEKEWVCTPRNEKELPVIETSSELHG